jgi:hypothetical protein
MRAIEGILRTLVQYHAFYRELARLGRRSDRELSQSGIGRGDLVRVAYEQAERQAADPGRSDTAVATWPPTVAMSRH